MLLRWLYSVVLLTFLLVPSPHALAQEATPTAGTSAFAAEPLFSITLPAGTLPAADLNVTLRSAVFKPGSVEHTAAAPDQEGTSVVVVMEGSWGIRTDAPLTVVRRSGATEQVAGGAEAVLQTGDEAIYPTGAGRVTRAVGDGRAVVLALAIAGQGGATPASPATPGVGEVDTVALIDAVVANDLWAPTGLGALAATLSLRRLTVQPGGELPRSAETQPTFWAVAKGTLTWGVIAAGADKPGFPVEAGQGDTLGWKPLAAGKSYLLRNNGTEPLVLYQVTIEPAAPEATPVARS